MVRGHAGFVLPARGRARVALNGRQAERVCYTGSMRNLSSDRTVRLAAAGLLLAAARPAPLPAQEPAPPEPAAEAPAAAAEPLLPGGADPWTPPLRALHAETAAGLARIDALRRRKLGELLDRTAAAAADDYETAKRVRNVRSMMVAREFGKAAEAAAAELASRGDFDAPADARRELKAPLDRLMADKAAIEEQAARAGRTILDRRLPAFSAAVRAQPGGEDLGEDALRRALERWAAASPPAEPAGAPPPSPAPGGGPPGDGPQDVGTPPPDRALPAPPPGVIAQRGEATAWEAVGTWTAEMMGPDVLRLPVSGPAGTKEGSQVNILTGKASTWVYEAARPLPPGAGTALRLKSLPDRKGVDVVEWPREANGGALVVRTQNAPSFPSPHGFELQAAAGAATADAGPRAARDRRVPVPVETTPPGAMVFVDGRAWMEDGEPARTPCRLLLPPGPHAIRLSLAGHLDRDVAGFEAAPGRRVVWSFQSEKSLPGKTVRVDAKKPWEPSGIRVELGQSFWVLAEGRWVCGSRGEPCGPEGYPDGPAYRHYAAGTDATRQLPDAPYGALLVRVGWEETRAKAVVGRERKLKSRSSGPLRFDINEGTEDDARKDNRGSLEVTVILLPTGH